MNRVDRFTPREIKAARVRCGYTQKDVAEELGISCSSYSDKERGKTGFTDEEKTHISIMLRLSLHQFNDIFFEGKLPKGTIE